MNAHLSSDFKNLCEEFVSAFGDSLLWKWDDRFKAVLAEFDVTNQDNIHGILKRFLTNSWDSSTIDNAPDTIKEIINKFNGLKSGQLILSSDPGRGDFLYGVWWPWGSGTRISVRIIPSFNNSSGLDHTEWLNSFREWFNI